jgi:hypothetical protein
MRVSFAQAIRYPQEQCPLDSFATRAGDSGIGAPGPDLPAFSFAPILL